MDENQKKTKVGPNLSPELSVVMPCYNEGGQIENIVREWLETLRHHVKNFELVVVNDGSNDGTGRTLDALRRENSEIRVIHQLHIGHGRAVRRGYESARGRYVLQVDGNGRYEPNDFLRMWAERKHFHLILGMRTHRLDSFFRRTASKLMITVLRLLFRIQLRDPNVPFRLYTKVALLSYLKQLPPNRESINLSLATLIKLNYPKHVAEIPVPYRGRSHGRSHQRLGGTLSQGWQFFFELLRLRLSPFHKSAPFLSSPLPE